MAAIIRSKACAAARNGLTRLRFSTISQSVSPASSYSAFVITCFDSVAPTSKSVHEPVEHNPNSFVEEWDRERVRDGDYSWLPDCPVMDESRRQPQSDIRIPGDSSSSSDVVIEAMNRNAREGTKVSNMLMKNALMGMRCM